LLEQALSLHRAEFKVRLSEGKVTDPLGMGYGLEGDSILDKMASVNKMIVNAKDLMKVAMHEGVIGMLKTIESINKAEALEHVKNTTPYGVIYTTTGGRKSKKMFESADARAYWIELRSDSIRDPQMIDPETIEKAINRAAKR
jgi:methionine synthase II (cobalamin-independent)